MHRITSTGAGHAIARLNIGNAFADRKHRASAAVTGTLRLIQTAADRLHRGQNPVPLNFADDFAHQIGTRSGFLEQVLPRKFDEARSVPAETTDAAMRTSTHPGRSCGAGTSSTLIAAGARVLEYLFHALATCWGKFSSSNLCAARREMLASRIPA